MKVCSRCSEEKDDTQFYKNRRTCKTCYLPIARKWQIENPEKHRESVRKAAKKAYESNPTPTLETNRKWRDANREWIAAHNRQYHQDNPEMGAFHRKLRVSRVRAQTPTWANQAEIKKFYLEARKLSKETGVPHCVDHIIPLQGKLVSGLHVESNLQILTKSENSRKRNSYAH